MARPRSVRDDQILRAARAVFLAKGISGTAAEIARRAGVSQGSIFNRWRTKKELFRLAIVPAGEPVWTKTLATKRGEPRDVLLRAGRQALDYFRMISPLLIMTWANADAVSVGTSGAQVLRTFRYLSDWFAANTRMRSPAREPQVLAWVFLGSIHGYVLNEILQRSPAHERVEPERFLRGLVDLVWPAVPKQTRRSSRSQGRQS